MSRFSCRTFALSAVVCFATSSFAQSAQVQGRITDPQNAVIPGAQVALRNTATGKQQRVTTNRNGLYTLPFVTPGTYQISVQAPGFSTTLSDSLTLSVGQALAFNAQLRIGSAQEQVTVDTASSTLNTTSATVSTVIDRSFVENMPLNGRSFQDLISMAPGVTTQNPQSGSTIGVNSDFSVNGQRTESNYYTVDGVAANINAGNGGGNYSIATSGSLPASTALGTTQGLLSVDALQEFRILSSTFSAEYGRTPGGQVMLESRAGTNTIHGTAFDYLRNNFFDANDWFNDYLHVAQPPLRQNDFGGTVGGPVWLPHVYNGSNRTFFFASYEGLRLTLPQAASAQFVPSNSLRAGANSIIQPMLNAFPLPTGAESTIACNNTTVSCNGGAVGSQVPSGLASFSMPYSLPSKIDSTSGRIDQTFGSRFSMFFRFGYNPTSSATRTLSALTHRNLNTQMYTGGFSGKISNRIVNEFRVNYSRGDSYVKGQIDNFGGATPIDLAAALGSGAAGTEPLFFISISGVASPLLAYLDTSALLRQWNVVDTTSLTAGHHQLRFGIDNRRVKTPTVLPNVVQAFFTSRAQIIGNTTSSLTLTKELPGTPIFSQFSAFVQDEWRLSQRVNLSLGLRYEVNPAPHGADGNDAYTLLGNRAVPSSLSLAPRGTPLWQTTYLNFAPRVGASWLVSNLPGWETVLRAGGGVYFDTDNAQAAMGFSGLGFYASKSIAGASLPATSAQLNFSPSVSAPYTGTTVYAFPQHLQLPYTLQYNASLQQALGSRQSFTLSYVAANGRRLLGEQEQMLAKFNPNFGTVIYYVTGLTSSYNAMQARFQRTVGHGVNAFVSYTWSHAIDFGSNSQVLQLQRGDSDYDVRNNIQGGLAWDIASPVKNTIGDALLGHWGLDARLISRTSMPVQLGGSLFTDPATGNYYRGGLNINPTQPLYIRQATCGAGVTCSPGHRIINKAAFSLPTASTLGNAPRNIVRGFGETQINMAVRREFPVIDRLKLQFRAEAFNILNHPNFGFIDSTYNDAAFGQAQKTLASSLGTLTPQYQQGGARSMQFALKLIF